MSRFNMYEAIAKSHNDAYPDGPYVNSADVRDELHRLLEIYGRFKRMQEATQDAQHCSFCGRSRVKLIGGPNGVCICNECVETCQEIFGEEQQSRH